MRRLFIALFFLLLTIGRGYGQSPSFKTYMNPVIPGDHPDCTLTRIGNYYYTTGSSFSTTPVIYRSTDLIHWEVISHPVTNAWPLFGEKPTDGIWGGNLVYYKNKYWDFFGHASKMFFVTAHKPQGPWSKPQEMKCPESVPGLGMDNSIFVDDTTWYLLVKNGRSSNWILQLGDDGQPAGSIYNLTWINPGPKYPFSWAEGPVMWKYKDYYYYCFALNLYGGQKVFRSRVLTSDSVSWVNMGNFFNENDPAKSGALFQLPNHNSAPVMLNDGTFWVISHSYSIEEWRGQGRQGLVSQVHYNEELKPTADFPVNKPMAAPDLPSCGIPWMVPKSDFFNSDTLNPEWEFIGYTPNVPYSLKTKPGWLELLPYNKLNTVVKNDAEHNYSLITRLDFNPISPGDEAGLRIMTGLQNLYAKLYSGDSAGSKYIFFSYGNIKNAVVNNIGNTLWLKLVRVNHRLTGYFGADGFSWEQIGNSIDVSAMDVQQPDFNAFTGNRQGLYVQGRPAFFDLYIYRDAYTPILADCPANQFGTMPDKAGALGSINNNDWALYAGVEFGNKDYPKKPDSVYVTAASASAGGNLEVWIDSLDTGTKIAQCRIGNTGGRNTFKTFTAPVLNVSGRHDVYLRFTGKSKSELFRLKWFHFISRKVN